MCVTSIDFFYISLGIGFSILVGCAVMVTVQLVRILADIRTVSKGVSGVALDLTSVKDSLKFLVLKFVQSKLDKMKKGGDSKNESLK